MQRSEGIIWKNIPGTGEEAKSRGETETGKEKRKGSERRKGEKEKRKEKQKEKAEHPGRKERKGNKVLIMDRKKEERTNKMGNRKGRAKT